jgi:ParB/RepB/Spo0J family partition protein
MEVELHQLNLRYASLRAEQPRLERQLLADLAEEGQRQPLVVVQGEENTFTLIDGYKRVRALDRLGRDTAKVLVWGVSEAEALVVERLMRRGEADSAIEEGWLLRELAEVHGLSHGEMARRFGKSTSWVSRRLGLVTALPAQVAHAVARGSISAYAAEKYLLPLARANATEVENIAQAIARQPMSTRSIERLVADYQRATPAVRARILADPQLYVRAQATTEPASQPAQEHSPAEAVRSSLLRLATQVGRCQQVLSEHSCHLTDVQRQQAREMIAGIDQSLAILVCVAESEVGYARPQYTGGNSQVA